MAEITRQPDAIDRIAQANAMKAEMRQNILTRLQQSNFARDIDPLYNSKFSRGVAAALHDCFRRVIEQGFFGKDQFDGRWNMDNQLGQSRDTAVHTMGQQYSSLAEFFGWDSPDNSKDQGQKIEAPEIDRSDDGGLER